MRRSVWLVVVLISKIGCAFTQQEVYYSQYLFEKLFYNPAFAGNTGDNVSFTFLNKNQWTGIYNTFNAQGLSINTSLSQERLGLGFNVQSENFSVYRLTYFQIPISYKIRLNNGYLSFGLEGGAAVSRYDYSQITIKDKDDKVVEELNRLRPDLSFGVFYRKRNYYFGASLKHMLNYSSYDSEIRFKFNHRVFYGNIAYKILLNHNFHVISSGILRLVGDNYYLDAGGHLNYQKFVWLGAFIRSSKQVNVQAILLLNQFVKKINNRLLVGYSFDFGYSKLYTVSGPSHEIMLKYDLKKRPNPDQIRKQRKFVSPLFF